MTCSMNRSAVSSAAVSRRSLIKAAGASVATLAATAGLAAPALADEAAAPATPKYIFLFIGDGMGVTQVQLASFFRGTVENDGAVVSSPLNFMAFPHVASVTTYDSTSFCPDSASTATSIATGNKTHSGVINMDPETKEIPFETIAEKLHSQQGYQIGVISTVNMNHATPAAFYAHQASRKNYYEIGEELAASGFEYYAGGSFLSPTGSDGDRADLLDVAREAGYTVATTQDEAAALTSADVPALVIGEVVADGGAMSYEIDRAEDEWSFADYLRKGVEVLGDEKPFFMMAEGGKIDWACHANDAAASVHDVLALEDAVQVAIDFAAEHADETLILVTADHETGGLAIGYKTTNYDTFLTNLTKQTISYVKFDTDYVPRYVEEKTPFADALADVKACFGLMAADDPDAAAADEVGVNGSLVMTNYELQQLQTAYERDLEVGAAGQGDMDQADYELYGTYRPFSMAICHILDHKSGLDHATYAHTGAPVNVWADGCGSELFDGAIDNIEIYTKLAALTSVE